MLRWTATTDKNNNNDLAQMTAVLHHPRSPYDRCHYVHVCLVVWKTPIARICQRRHVGYHDNLKLQPSSAQQVLWSSDATGGLATCCMHQWPCIHVQTTARIRKTRSAASPRN